MKGNKSQFASLRHIFSPFGLQSVKIASLKRFVQVAFLLYLCTTQENSRMGSLFCYPYLRLHEHPEQFSFMLF